MGDLPTSANAVWLLPPGTNALTNSAFATYVLSTFTYALYLFIGATPESVLTDTLWITYHPSPAWTLILPAWLTVFVWFIYIAFASRNILVTPRIDGYDGLRSMTDPSSIILPRHSNKNTHPRAQTDKSLWETEAAAGDYDKPVPTLCDLPCQVVNQFYFSEKPVSLPLDDEGC